MLNKERGSEFRYLNSIKISLILNYFKKNKNEKSKANI